MGVSHLLGLAETELTGLFTRRPPLAVQRLAVLGYDETDPSSYRRPVFDARPELTVPLPASCCYLMAGRRSVADLEHHPTRSHRR